MEGFKTIWADGKETGCVVLFNSAWVLRDRSDFLLAFVLLVVGGSLSEAIGYVRRALKTRFAKHRTLDSRQRTALSLAFTLHILVGYLLMLCAMTYQLELLVAVAAGLGIGHYIFNADAPVLGERADPCCPDEPATEKSALIPDVMA